MTDPETVEDPQPTSVELGEDMQRNLFAAAAMAGLLANGRDIGSADHVAERAWDMAESMLAWKSK